MINKNLQAQEKDNWGWGSNWLKVRGEGEGKLITNPTSLNTNLFSDLMILQY